MKRLIIICAIAAVILTATDQAQADTLNVPSDYLTTQAATNYLNDNNDMAAINTLKAFIRAVEAQPGKQIPEADADTLIAAAQQIIDLLMVI